MVMERKSELILDRDVSIDRFFEEPVDADAALPILRVWGRRTLKWQLLFGLGLCRLRRDDRRSCGARWSKFLFQLGVSKATVSRRVALVRDLLSFLGAAALETYSFPNDELVHFAWTRLNAESFKMKHFIEHRRQAFLSDYCPPPRFHEPAVDAFFWGVVAWADAFGLSMGVDQVEWGRVFIYPHDEFANYLRPGNPPEPLPTVDGSPANIILTLDATWTELVIKLTAQYGLFYHLKDREAMLEAQRLEGELRTPGSPAYKAFLESDLAFFRHLFKHFPFSERTRKYINAWLKKAEEAL